MAKMVKIKGVGKRGKEPAAVWALLSPIIIQMLGIPSLLSPLGENLVSTSGFKTSDIHWCQSSGLFSIIFYAWVGG